MASRASHDGPRPFSRFKEGSMNDRTSAAPPAQFLGPEHVANFEKQFYSRRETRSSRRQRRERPMSASAQLQGNPYMAFQTPSEPQPEQAQQPQLKSKKSTGFLGRVRDAFGFGRGLRGTSKVQQEMGKRTSLQESPMSIPMQTQTRTRPRPPITKSQSQTFIGSQPINIPKANSFDDRPSRDEIMQSYNQLMATGFFQAHAIQSTRQPPPGAATRTGAGTSRRPAPLPTIPSRSSLESLPRLSFSTMPKVPDSPVSARTSFISTHGVFTGPSSAPSAFQGPPVPPRRSSTESVRYHLRGRKRARGPELDDKDSESASLTQQSHEDIGRRVSKKLRKMPSAASTILNADGIIRRVSSVKDVNAMSEPEETPVRLRSPSPAAPGPTANRGRLNVTRKCTITTSSGNKLRKPSHRNPKVSKPPVALDRFYRSNKLTEADLMDIDTGSGSSSNRESLESERGVLLREGQGVASPLSVLPDSNSGIPSVPRIPDYYQHRRGMWDENIGLFTGNQMDWRFGEAT